MRRYQLTFFVILASACVVLHLTHHKGYANPYGFLVTLDIDVMAAALLSVSSLCVPDGGPIPIVVIAALFRLSLRLPAVASPVRITG